MPKIFSDKPFFLSKSSFNDASIILIGAPLEVTGCSRPGVKLAPASVRAISWTLEDYNIIEKRAISDVAFFDSGNIFFTGDLKNNLLEIETFVKKCGKLGKKVLMLGGEHLITYPAVSALAKKHRDLHFIVFDAHTDLEDIERKMSISHATTTKLVFNLLGKGRVFLFGARSGVKGDIEFMKKNIFYSPDPPEKVLFEKIADKPVYISVDIDVLDPSIAPGVSTPEVLGWNLQQLMEALEKLSCFSKIVGADVVEICPPYDPAEVTSLIGATVVRKLIFLMDKK